METAIWYGKGCKYQCCTWEGNEFTDGPDYKQGFPELVFCNNKDNKKDHEGNCCAEWCPIKD